MHRVKKCTIIKPEYGKIYNLQVRADWLCG